MKHSYLSVLRKTQCVRSNHESSDTATATRFASSIAILDTVYIVTQMRLHPVKEARWFLRENALNFNFSCRINIFFTTSQSVGTIGFAQGKNKLPTN